MQDLLMLEEEKSMDNKEFEGQLFIQSRRIVENI